MRGACPFCCACSSNRGIIVELRGWIRSNSVWRSTRWHDVLCSCFTLSYLAIKFSSGYIHQSYASITHDTLVDAEPGRGWRILWANEQDIRCLLLLLVRRVTCCMILPLSNIVAHISLSTCRSWMCARKLTVKHLRALSRSASSSLAESQKHQVPDQVCFTRKCSVK